MAGMLVKRLLKQYDDELDSHTFGQDRRSQMGNVDSHLLRQSHLFLLSKFITICQIVNKTWIPRQYFFPCFQSFRSIGAHIGKHDIHSSCRYHSISASRFFVIFYVINNVWFLSWYSFSCFQHCVLLVSMCVYLITSSYVCPVLFWNHLSLKSLSYIYCQLYSIKSLRLSILYFLPGL